MAKEWLIGFILLSLPLLAAFGMVLYMMTGKGKPAPTQDMIEKAREEKNSAG
jgi:hypothetical protein